MHPHFEPIRVIASLQPPQRRYVTSVHVYFPIIFEFLYGKGGPSARTFRGHYPYCHRQRIVDVELGVLQLLDPRAVSAS